MLSYSLAVELERYLTAEGYSPKVRAEVARLVGQRVDALAADGFRKDAIPDHPLVKAIDRLLGEPLRQWNGLLKEMREDNAKLLILYGAMKMTTCRREAEDGVDALGAQLDGLEAAVRHSYDGKGHPAPSCEPYQPLGGKPHYYEEAAEKARLQNEVRQLTEFEVFSPLRQN